MFANDLRKIDASARYMDEVVWSHYRDVFVSLIDIYKHYLLPVFYQLLLVG